MKVLGYTESGSIRVDIDGIEMTVPDDMSNRHRQMIAAWEAGGGVIAPYQPSLPGEDDYRLAIQNLIDTHAQGRRYDGGNSLATYVASSNPDWASEAQAFVIWRDAVWAYAYVEMDKVMGGLRDQPTVQEFLDELPIMEWPANG